MRGDIFGRFGAPLAAIAAAIFALGVGLSVAQAQDTKPADTKPADAKPADTKPADAKAATPAPKTEKKTAAAPSPCKGLDETTCKANSECTWYKEAKLKDGKTRKAHCQKKPSPPKAKKKT